MDTESRTLLTTAQVASRLGKSVSQVNRLAEAGRIKTAVKLPGRNGARLFEPGDVLEFIDEVAS